MSATINAAPAFRLILKIIALMMTAQWPFEIVPACSLVAKVTLLQPRPFAAGHMSHHPKTALHKMAWRWPMALHA
jgi:hypothetical protein